MVRLVALLLESVQAGLQVFLLRFVNDDSTDVRHDCIMRVSGGFGKGKARLLSQREAFLLLFQHFRLAAVWVVCYGQRYYGS